MPPLIALIAPLALASTVPGGTGSASDRLGPPTAQGQAKAAPVSQRVADEFPADAARQVRIQQRVVIRVAPYSLGRDLPADLPEQRAAPFRERKVGKCLPASGILGVAMGEADRLLLFMRDQRLISASLEKACRARDFYSGFYVERSDDGRLCVDRDRLHSRTGSACSLSRLRQLVAVDE